jgi:predicted nucleic acid-binding protein
VADPWVVNASPIILLAKAGVVQFLPLLCEPLVIPAGVLEEVKNYKASVAGKS